MIGRLAGGLLLVAAVAGLLAGCGADDDFEQVPGFGPTRIDVPRPTGVASAPCDEDPLPPASDETTAERVAALRAAGLFADRSDVTDTDLADEIDANIEALWGAEFPVDDPLRDLAVAEQDAGRVLWIDLEADVGDGNLVYEGVVESLQDISVGAFQPSAVAETWAGGTGPITVAFELGGAHHEIAPAYLEDWIDPGILVAINGLIGGTGRRYELYRAFDQTALIMALTDPERAALEARGWCFE